jgi:hypothetical protein
MSTWDDKPNDYEHALVWIAKLRDTVEHYKADAAHDEALIKELRAALEAAAQKFIDLAPKDGKTDATEFFQAAVNLRALGLF